MSETVPRPTGVPRDRQAFYGDLSDQNLEPLWETLHTLVTPQPVSPVRAMKWDYQNVVRARLMQAGELISAREAERRVLVLENPGLPGQAAATHSLYAGVQLVLPHEVAPAHRHSQGTVRFILEGAGGYTSVEGERIPLFPGDIVITPGWTWHDHGNDTDTPMVWLDVMDVPLVGMLDAGFGEAENAEGQAPVRPAGDSSARFAQNIFPVDWKPESCSSPIFNYPYGRSRETLAILAAGEAEDPCHGYKVRYVNPANGRHVAPTIGAFMQLLPTGFVGATYRSTDSAIYVVVEGEGETRIGDQVIRWKPRDIFVVPSWAAHSHRASSEAVLFSASDRPVHEALSLWREERRDA